MDGRWYQIPRIEPLSLNNAYRTATTKKGVPIRVKTTAAKKYLKRVQEEMRTIDHVRGSKHLPHAFYDIHYIFLTGELGWFFKNGKLRKKDVSNMLKLTEDAVFTYFGNDEDDAQVVDVHGHKRIRPVPGEESSILIYVSPSSLDAPVWIDGEAFELHQLMGLGCVQ